MENIEVNDMPEDKESKEISMEDVDNRFDELVRESNIIKRIWDHWSEWVITISSNWTWTWITISKYNKDTRSYYKLERSNLDWQSHYVLSVVVNTWKDDSYDGAEYSPSDKLLNLNTPEEVMQSLDRINGRLTEAENYMRLDKKKEIEELNEFAHLNDSKEADDYLDRNLQNMV